VHAGEEGHARRGWTTSRRGQDSPWKSQSECLCVCVCVCLSTIMSSDLYTSDLRHFFALATYGRGWVLLWRRSDTLCTSGFMDDAIFANKPRLLDVDAQLKRNAHAALGLAISCAQ